MDWVVNELRVAIENDLQLPDSEPVRSHFLNSMCSYLVMNIRSRSKNDKFLVSWNFAQWLLLLKKHLNIYNSNQPVTIFCKKTYFRSWNWFLKLFMILYHLYKFSGRNSGYPERYEQNFKICQNEKILLLNSVFISLT